MFDEQPDGNPHGECAAKIHQLQAENEKFRDAFKDLLSVRDQFAKAALQGLCANPGGPFQANDRCGWGTVNTTFDGIAQDAYALADAMMKARAHGVDVPGEGKKE